uniref:Secreted protein n=1 Tax=Raphanus sativus TaxID=3726 RepID=A0A650GAM5_RAPSA|nr:hypothetical protein [Raphanus sativus]
MPPLYFLLSQLFTLCFRIISLDLFQTNSLHSHLIHGNEENYMGSTLTPARTKGPDQAQTDRTRHQKSSFAQCLSDMEGGSFKRNFHLIF